MQLKQLALEDESAKERERKRERERERDWQKNLRLGSAQPEGQKPKEGLTSSLSLAKRRYKEGRVRIFSET